MNEFFDKEFLPWLDSFLNFEKLPQKNIFWLDMMESLCRLFNNPERQVPSFHIAGSKGKGSVSAFIASILDAYGKKVTLYSSPHLKDFRERISGAHGLLDEKTYTEAAGLLMSRIQNLTGKELPEGRSITWFELVTLYAFLVTELSKADYGVYEVGLGGRLDATNVITPVISVLNTIELEHTEFLGNTLEKIAGEKAGIIKKGVPVISSAQDECVRKVFRDIAEKNGSAIYFADELVKNLTYVYLKDHNTRQMNIKFSSDLFTRPICADLKMPGEFQARNAVLASLAVKLALPEITEACIEEGLENTVLPARFQLISNGKEQMVLDGAHTVKSISGTMNTFNALYEGKAVLLFACAADKNAEEIAALFKGRFHKIFLTRPGFTKTYDKERLFKAFRNAGLEFEWIEDHYQAIKKARQYSTEENAVLLVTGSFYLAGGVLELLQSM